MTFILSTERILSTFYDLVSNYVLNDLKLKSLHLITISKS